MAASGHSLSYVKIQAATPAHCQRLLTFLPCRINLCSLSILVVWFNMLPLCMLALLLQYMSCSWTRYYVVCTPASKLSSYAVAAQLDCFKLHLTPYVHMAMQVINNVTAAVEQQTLVWLQRDTACDSSTYRYTGTRIQVHPDPVAIHQQTRSIKVRQPFRRYCNSLMTFTEPTSSNLSNSCVRAQQVCNNSM